MKKNGETNTAGRKRPWMFATALLFGACAQTNAGVGNSMANDDNQMVAQGMNDMEMEMDMEMQMADPSPATRSVLQQAEGYADWPMFPEHREQPERSRGHDDMWVVAHYNDVAAEVVGRTDVPFPDGSVLVKENRPQPDAPPMALTTMAKQDGEWYWVKHSPDGRVLVENGMAAEGQVDMCIGCHAAAPHDMVFGGR
jgi:hypothetical protein